MKIKKLDFELTSSSRYWTDTYEIDGKEVRFYGYDVQGDEYDSGYDMDEDDRELLTDEEVDMFDELEGELSDLEVGEIKEVEE